ncbi:MAG: phosphonate ABC transporter ATP-binding protein, partial [Proteobacteria bacterium]|nr:phosphonate ABC transporter ATP-binding protein [Pseudomonadota bacterium]
GLRAGEVVFDGKPEELDDSVLTLIYGEEDWTAMRGKAREDEDGRDREERLAGMV